MGRFIEHVRISVLSSDPIFNFRFPLVSHKYSIRRVSLFVFCIFVWALIFSQPFSILGGSESRCPRFKSSHLVSSHSGGCSWRPGCSASIKTDAKKCTLVGPRIFYPSVDSMLPWDRGMSIIDIRGVSIFVPAEACIKQCV